jgi:hypothetical protein
MWCLCQKNLKISPSLCCQIVVNVTDDLLSRASMTVVNSRPTLTINIATAREHWLEGMLRHEIGWYYNSIIPLGVLSFVKRCTNPSVCSSIAATQ